MNCIILSCMLVDVVLCAGGCGAMCWWVWCCLLVGVVLCAGGCDVVC